jgi:hypothetical protein
LKPGLETGFEKKWPGFNKLGFFIEFEKSCSGYRHKKMRQKCFGAFL